MPLLGNGEGCGLISSLDWRNRGGLFPVRGGPQKKQSKHASRQAVKDWEVKVGAAVVGTAGIGLWAPFYSLADKRFGALSVL
jgi:hypothetical protein